MKRTLILFILLFVAGCGMTVNGGDPNSPPIIMDPNQVAALESAAQTITAIGVAIGHAELVGLGALLTVMIGALLKKRGK